MQVRLGLAGLVGLSEWIWAQLAVQGVLVDLKIPTKAFLHLFLCERSLGVWNDAILTQLCLSAIRRSI